MIKALSNARDGFQHTVFCAYEEGNESQLNTSCSPTGPMLRVYSREQVFEKFSKNNND